MAIIDGARIRLRGREFTIPPLTLAAIKRLTLNGSIAAINAASASGAMSVEQIDAALALVYEAMRPNYPDITVDEIADLVDMGNMKPVVQAVMAQSGFVEGEAAAP